MPLNKKGKKIMTNMKTTYGKDAKSVFYASKNKGTIADVEGKAKAVKAKPKKKVAKKK